MSRRNLLLDSLGHAQRMLAWIALPFAVGCSSSPAPEVPLDDGAARSDTQRQGTGVGVEADIGALNEGQVTSTFQKAQGAFGRCMDSGRSRLPYLSGSVHFKVRVGASGKANSAFLTRSTLGDHDTETCMLGALKSASWPAPVGGKEGIAETEFTFDADGSVRQPVEWAPEDAGKNVRNAREAFKKCARGAGAGKMTATLYVETDGSVLSVGLAGEDDGAERAASCVISALKEVKFNSPGSFAAKLVLTDS